jgi:L-asparagine transporter-like permease
MRRRAASDTGDGYRMPWWPMPPAVALLAILAIFVVGVMDPNQWLSLGIAVGIIAAGYAYYFCYLRSRAGTHLLLLEVRDDEEV